MASFPTTFLVADDGSSESDMAFDTALALAHATGASLALVHVKSVAPSVVGTMLTPTHEQRLREQGQALIEQRVAQASARGLELGSTSVRLERRIEAAVRDVAVELGAGMLIVGARGASAGQRYILGDLSMRLVRDAPCSVLVVHAEPAETPHGSTRSTRDDDIR